MNQITDITPLEGLREMKKLLIFENKITDLRPLARMKNLRILHIYFNSIPEDQKAMLRNALPDCKIRF